MGYPFKTVSFVKTALTPDHYPKMGRMEGGSDMPEIAVIGRSNVGKSSLLNYLFARRAMVKTSATPGKTQALNFFLVDESLLITDLPGYGYAQVPIEVRQSWGKRIQAYLDKREALKGFLFLLDIRREPNKDDRAFIEWARHVGKPMIVVLTKVDKVSASECKKQTAAILKAFGDEIPPYIHTSTTEKMGRDLLIKEINQLLS